MLRRFAFTFGTIFLVSAFLLLALGKLGADLHPAYALNSSRTLLTQLEKEQIFRSTVQIEMLSMEQVVTEGTAPAAAGQEPTQSFTDITSVNGLGTVVIHQNKLLVITHDHWLLLEPGMRLDLVQFSDTQGKLLLEMSGADFKRGILFRDGGVLILRAPPELSRKMGTYPSLGDSRALAPGDIVHLAINGHKSQDGVSLTEAEVTAVESDTGANKLTLRSVNGQSIEAGDSGGGIWLDGRLYGNIWTTLRVENRGWWYPGGVNQRATDLSRAAGVTNETVLLMTALLDHKTPPAD